MRVRRLHREFALTLDARVTERTTLARELHDTLLQSFHGLIPRLQIVSELLPDRPADAKKHVDRAMELAAHAVTEGRDAVQGLRASTVQMNDLARGIRTLGEELAADSANDGSPMFSVTVEGESRDLHPILRDEVYRIAGESLRNAFRHAQAQRVEVEIRYDVEQFRLRVRDDGKGIDPKVLSGHAPEGHFGLAGLRERARAIGGKLSIWSEVGAGTEVELQIPAGAAYLRTARRSWISELLAKR
jgi:signal transduction histidine kinase